MRTYYYSYAFSFIVGLCSPLVFASDNDELNQFDELEALLDMPLDTLADTKIITATKTSLSLSDVPASVHVITAKEIERSAARSVADVLSLAPGLHVAKFSDYDWSISSRSKNKNKNNDLLVMIDGRSVVSPMYSGVNWDLLPVSLDNIDRIEVVLGPVGTMWGGNAINGVINIITKHAENASQAQVSATIGNYNYREYKAHHSGQVNDNIHLSGYIEALQHSPFTDESPHLSSLDHLTVLTERFGLRADYQHLEDTLSIQFGGIRSREEYQWLSYNPAFLDPSENKGDYDQFITEMLSQEWFAGLQYLHEKSNGDQWENQAWLTYNDSNNADEPATFTRIDVDSRYTFSDTGLGGLTVGVNARIVDEQFFEFSKEEQYTSPYVRTTDEHDFLSQSYGIYANWTYQLTKNTELMLGNRWQYSNITDEVYSQPQVRALQKLTSNQRLWLGWGRAVVTPSRLELETDFQQNQYCSDCMYSVNPDGSLKYYDYFVTYHYDGNADLKMEEVDTFEVGYRYSNNKRLQFNASLYYSQHDNVRAYQGLDTNRVINPGENGANDTVIDNYYSQMIAPLSQKTIGGELSVKWQPRADLQINTNYSYKQIEGACSGAVCESSNLPILDLENSPAHYATLHIMWDIHPTIWLSSVVNYVSKSEPDEALKENDEQQSGDRNASVWPEVITWDVSAHWQHKPNWPSVTFSIENLANDQVKEYSEQYNPFANGTQYYFEFQWDFI